jgi:hypothetical protein
VTLIIQIIVITDVVSRSTFDRVMDLGECVQLVMNKEKLGNYLSEYNADLGLMEMIRKIGLSMRVRIWWTNFTLGLGTRVECSLWGNCEISAQRCPSALFGAFRAVS